MLLIQRVELFVVKQISEIEVFADLKGKLDDLKENKSVEIERKKPLFLLRKRG